MEYETFEAFVAGEAWRYEGAIVLIGVTEADPDGTVVRQYQLWGIIESVCPCCGITVELHGEGRHRKSYRLPPAPEALERAAPGHYRLTSTGEVIVDPDYVTSWTITPPLN